MSNYYFWRRSRNGALFHTRPYRNSGFVRTPVEIARSLIGPTSVFSPWFPVGMKLFRALTYVYATAGADARARARAYVRADRGPRRCNRQRREARIRVRAPGPQLF